MTILYGIRQCDTVRKARQWLESRCIDYTFHDLRIDGIDAATIESWFAQIGLETLLNRRGTTWRRLSEQEKKRADAATAVTLLLEHPTLIKRPVLNHKGKITVGFKGSDYTILFSTRS